MIRLLIFFTLFSHLSLAHGACTFEDLKPKICVSDSEAMGDKGSENVVCEAADKHGPTYQILQDSFNLAPVFFQNYLCDLKALYVYPLAEPMKRVLSWTLPYKRTIGINKTLLDNKVDLVSHLNKDVGSVTGKVLNELGPIAQYTAASNNSTAMVLLKLLGHEMGHVFYTHPKYDRVYFEKCTGFFTLKCEDFNGQQFGSIDWIEGYKNKSSLSPIQRGTIKTEDALLRDYVLFETPKSPKNRDAFYNLLFKSSFLSAFSLLSPEEDFCESLSAYVIASTGLTLTFTEASGKSFDPLERMMMNSSSLSDKRVFIEEFIGKATDLKFPSEMTVK
jgi:hypothetical protein